jgi:hypothetical protein
MAGVGELVGEEDDALVAIGAVSVLVLPASSAKAGELIRKDASVKLRYAFRLFRVGDLLTAASDSPGFPKYMFHIEQLITP